jgi:hypothetical protein
MRAATEQPPLWKGWFRPNKQTQWTHLVEGEPSYDRAWQKLLDALASMNGGESLVTTTDPNKQLPLRGRHLF